MSGKKQFEISIDHAMLSGAKESFDQCLRLAFAKAISTGSYEGSAALKISFEILTVVDDDTGETAKEPEIRYKAGYSVPMKDSMDGTIVERSRLLVRDGKLKLINGQISMDELLAESVDE